MSAAAAVRGRRDAGPGVRRTRQAHPARPVSPAPGKNKNLAQPPIFSTRAKYEVCPFKFARIQFAFVTF